MPEFLPVSRADMAARGWEQCDFVYVIGDAYVDHPSFGHAIISRVLEGGTATRWGSSPSRTGRTLVSVWALGRPRLGFLVTGGNMDSMVNHYSVSRSAPEDRRLYPGRSDGKAAGPGYHGILQPDPPEPTGMYPSLIGGVEASLRRLAHYDYWSDQLCAGPFCWTAQRGPASSTAWESGASVEIADALDSGTCHRGHDLHRRHRLPDPGPGRQLCPP